MQVCLIIRGVRKRNESFYSLPVRVVTHTYLLRWTGVFDGIVAARCRSVPRAPRLMIMIEHLAGEKGKRHCLPNASIMIHRKVKTRDCRPIKLIFNPRTIWRGFRASLRYRDPC